MSVPLNPSGLCQCGCGERAPLATYTQARRGFVKGQPLRFIREHHKRRRRRYRFDESYYRIEDRGYETPCWMWALSLDGRGYGQAWSPETGKPGRAHRAMYEQEVGQIPEGLELDHLCFQTACVNPRHLEPVTGIENARRQADRRVGNERIEEILHLHAQGYTRGRIAKITGVNWHTVDNVLARHSLAISKAGRK